MTVGALLVLVGLSLVALFGYVASLNVEALDPAHIRLTERFRPPLSPADAALEGDSRPLFGIYWLGTDDLGRDVLARFLEGARVSLSIGLVVVVIGTGIGILLGGLAGFAGHRRIGPVTLDALIMRCTDLMLCFPSFFLILTVVALLPPSVYYIMLVLGLTGVEGHQSLLLEGCVSCQSLGDLLLRHEGVLVAHALLLGCGFGHGVVIGV